VLAALLAWDRPSAGQDMPPAREFIVKFRPASVGDRVAGQAMQDPAAQTALLADFAGALGGELRIPVRIQTATSGRELVLGVDAVKVADAAVAALAQRPDVVQAVRVAGDERPQVVPRDPMLAVEFAEDSAIGRRLAEGRPSPDDPDILSLTQDVAGRTGLPLTLHAEAPAILFTLDIGRLTSELEGRLKRRPDVAYVEPNLLLQPLAQ
jgi:hypothetical protein